MLLLEPLALEAKRITGKVTGKEDGVVHEGTVQKHLVHDSMLLDQFNLLVRVTVTFGVLEIDGGIIGPGQGMVAAQLDEVLDAGLLGRLEESAELARHVIALCDGVRWDAEDGVDILENFGEVEGITVPIEQDHLGRGGEVGNGMKLAGADADLVVVVSGGQEKLGDAESYRAVSVGDQDATGLVARNERGQELAQDASV